MQRVLLQLGAALVAGACLAYMQPLSAADTAEPAKPAADAAAPAAGAAAPAAGGAAPAAPAAAAGAPVEYMKAKSGTPESAADIKANPMKPTERAAKSPLGSLKNPY